MRRIEVPGVLRQHPGLDLVVVGGGATGLGVALDAALQGYSVALCEAHDFASGTSSRSTKLLHGGVRYLAQGNLALVREALHERKTLLHIAPHLCAPLAFVMPAYAIWALPFYGLGLKLYDLLAGKAGLGKTQWLNRLATQTLLPGVRSQGLRGSVKYWDAQFDDARLAVSLARSAARVGAFVCNYMRVVNLQALHGQNDGARWQVQLNDQHTGEMLSLRARCVVNATGVWVDDLRTKTQVSTQRMVTASQGVHLVVERTFLPGDNALLVPKTYDGRVLFAVPWLGKLILGTTDTVRNDAPREPEPMAGEVAFILREAGKVLQRQPQPSDVRSVWVGLRPLVAPHSSKTSAAISREHTIEIAPNGLVSVTGGKWTSYRSMAADAMNNIQQAELLSPKKRSNTQRHILLGADATTTTSASLTKPPGLHLFGDQASIVQHYPGADEELGMGLSAAMVRHMVRNEYALTVEDVLARRWRALFLDAESAMAMAPRVAEIVREETGAKPFLGEFQALCKRYVLR